MRYGGTTVNKKQVFQVLVFWANKEVRLMLPAHDRLVCKYYPLLYAEAISERTFSDSGLTAGAKRKRMDPDALSNATVANDNERNFPVSAADLQRAYNA